MAIGRQRTADIPKNKPFVRVSSYKASPIGIGKYRAISIVALTDCKIRTEEAPTNGRIGIARTCN